MFTFSFVQPFYLFKSLCVHFFFCTGFLLLLISNWFKTISPTISLAPEGYSCCPIVTVEVFKSCYYGDFVAAHRCFWCSCSSQHAHGDFVELNGIYILVVEEVRLKHSIFQHFLISAILMIMIIMIIILIISGGPTSSSLRWRMCLHKTGRKHWRRILFQVVVSSPTYMIQRSLYRRPVSIQCKRSKVGIRRKYNSLEIKRIPQRGFARRSRRDVSSHPNNINVPSNNNWRNYFSNNNENRNNSSIDNNRNNLSSLNSHRTNYRDINSANFCICHHLCWNYFGTNWRSSRRGGESDRGVERDFERGWYIFHPSLPSHHHHHHKNHDYI